MKRKISIIILAGMLLAVSATGFCADTDDQPGMEQWQVLSPDEKDRLREQYRNFKALPEGSREQLKNNYRMFKDLPEDEQNRIKENFKS